jgi:hypothetical protein
MVVGARRAASREAIQAFTSVEVTLAMARVPKVGRTRLRISAASRARVVERRFRRVASTCSAKSSKRVRPNAGSRHSPEGVGISV